MKKSPRADEPAENYQWACLRCGHRWNSQTFDKPKACAFCVSAYWDKPRITKRYKNWVRRSQPLRAGFRLRPPAFYSGAVGHAPGETNRGNGLEAPAGSGRDGGKRADGTEDPKRDHAVEDLDRQADN